MSFWASQNDKVKTAILHFFGFCLELIASVDQRAGQPATRVKGLDHGPKWWENYSASRWIWTHNILDVGTDSYHAELHAIKYHFIYLWLKTNAKEDSYYRMFYIA